MVTELRTDQTRYIEILLSFCSSTVGLVAQVRPRNGPDPVTEDAAQQAELKVGLVLVGQGVEEFIGEDRNLGGVDVRELVDVDDFVGCDRFVDESYLSRPATCGRRSGADTGAADRWGMA